MSSLEDLLRACVVRVEGGPLPGAGFFVAPELVVTCAHVVGTEGAPLSVRLANDSTITCETPPVLVCDQGRPIPELAADYPDLALIDVDVPGHACVALDFDWPQLEDRFQAYGFPSEGGSILLTPLALSYTGKKGQDDRLFIDLASKTPVTGGMSGSPLLNLRTRSVCAIVVATRDPKQAHGGLAVTWSELGQHLAAVIAANSAFHEHDRRWASARSPRRRRIVFGRAQTVAHFTGRTVELELLRQRLDAANWPLITQAITGLGGVGKTQLAAQYLQCHGEDYDLVAWIRAEDAGIADLAGLAATLGLDVTGLAPEDRAAAALRWLERCRERWLLVLDNLTGPEQLEGCCPAAGNGRVLITSRNRDLEQLGPLLSVDVFDDVTATEYLIARTGRADEYEDALALARALGGLPLALAHAGAYCAKSTNFADYQRLLDDLPPRALYDRSPEAFYRQTVASTWQTSIDAADREAPLARSVLVMAAHLAPDAIALTLFDALLNDRAEAQQRKQLIDAIRALDRYSLVDVTEASMSVHRLLQRVVLDTDASSDLARAAGRATLTALSAAMPPDPALPQWWPQYEQLLPHILALADTIERPGEAGPELIRLLNCACEYLNRAELGQRGLAIARIGLRHAERVVGAVHPETLTAREHLASAYLWTGRIEEAIAILQPLLADRERILGTEHPDTLTIRQSLAYAYLWTMRAEEAIAIFEALLTDRERILGTKNASTLRTRHSLAHASLVAGRFGEAVAIFEALVADDVRILGAGNPDTLEARHGLAYAYLIAGRFCEAIAIFEPLLVDRERIFGTEHPDPLRTRSGLGRAYLAAGRFGGAVAIFEALLADRERILGIEHPSTLGTRHSLADAYRAAGRVGEAIAIFEPLVVDDERILGAENPDTLEARHGVADAYLAAGRVGEAIAVFEALLTDRERILGIEHPDPLKTRSGLARAYLDAERVTEAIAIFEALLADDERILGPGYPDTLQVCHGLAYAYLAAGRVGEAIAIFEPLLTDRERVLGTQHPATLETCHGLADAYLAAGRVGEAIAIFEPLLTDRERVLGTKHPATLSTHHDLALAYQAAARPDDAAGVQRPDGASPL